GPVPATADEAALIDVRAGFLADAYDAGAVAACRDRLAAERRALDGLAAYDRGPLWVEPDLYDQSVLVRLLDLLADRPALRGRLDLIAVDGYPGVARFVGLGQLAPEQLATLPAAAAPVAEPQFTLARCAWRAFRAAEPQALWQIAEHRPAALPLLA